MTDNQSPSRRKTLTCIGLAALLLLGVGLYLANLSPGTNPGIEIKQQSFSFLKKIRTQKKNEVITYFNEIQQRAHSVKNDKLMLDFFRALLQGNHSPELEYEIDKHYVTEYGNFYDILFVDAKGLVFHSIRKENDYQKNLFAAEMTKTKLAKALRKPGDTQFVEFQYYPPSDEPAAFFTVSVNKGAAHLGWFVLQFATNSVNTILTLRRDLGRSGEVYLINQESLMLTDSRFMEDSTILHQKVDTQAVKDALQRNSGESIITDYRGQRVFSSYEKFMLAGVSWIIIAEIDEDEVITEHYKNNKKYFQNEFIRRLSQKEHQPYRAGRNNLRNKRVDMNEFAKTDKGKQLITQGVATCTAVAICYPGKFGYLAHISPTDEIYQNTLFTKILLGNQYHNFMSGLIGKIKFFEIYPHEINKLKIIITAPHTTSFAKAVDAALAHNIELANIKFLFDPQAMSADVTINDDGSSLNVQWTEKERIFVESSASTPDLGTLLKEIIGYTT
ncbi:MAG: cache domain-containing protein [Desulfobulbaceae bacterium]|nr:cache domain-containing protein [Desulfobulbaceae bacterium]